MHSLLAALAPAAPAATPPDEERVAWASERGPILPSPWSEVPARPAGAEATR